MRGSYRSPHAVRTSAQLLANAGQAGIKVLHQPRLNHLVRQRQLQSPGHAGSFLALYKGTERNSTRREPTNKLPRAAHQNPEPDPEAAPRLLPGCPDGQDPSRSAVGSARRRGLNHVGLARVRLSPPGRSAASTQPLSRGAQHASRPGVPSAPCRGERLPPGGPHFPLRPRFRSADHFRSPVLPCSVLRRKPRFLQSAPQALGSASERPETWTGKLRHRH